MDCQWCGSGHRVKEVRRNGVAVAGPVAGIPLHLCGMCWGRFRESGRRPDQTGRPQSGPNTGLQLTPQLLRQLGRR